MGAHVLLNLLNELGKRDEACGGFYLFFCNKFNKFNNIHKSTNVRPFLLLDKNTKCGYSFS